MGEEIRGALSATPHPSIAIAGTGTGIINHHHPTDFPISFLHSTLYRSCKRSTGKPSRISTSWRSPWRICKRTSAHHVSTASFHPTSGIQRPSAICLHHRIRHQSPISIYHTYITCTQGYLQHSVSLRLISTCHILSSQTVA